MQKFLEWLKESSTPAAWSKGVTLSRSPNSFERIGANTRPENESKEKELRFKIQGAERILAFTVTLWPDEEDAHCDCGSKTDPCHHIIGAALAHAEGRIPSGTDLPSGTTTGSGAKLYYHWEYLPAVHPRLPSLRFHRELRIRGEGTPIRGTLVGLIGGIRSGRIALPLPPTSPLDLAIDECYAGDAPSWKILLTRVEPLGPLPLTGHPSRNSLSVRSRADRTQLRILETSRGDLELKLITPQENELLEGGLRLIDGVLMLSAPHPPALRMHIPFREVASWTLNELPEWREACEILDERSRPITVEDGIPEFRLLLESLGSDEHRLTARIVYPAPPSGVIYRPSLAKEVELRKLLRRDFDLVPDQPRALTLADALSVRDRIPEYERQNYDGALAPLLWDQTGLNLERALEHRDLLIRLLEKRLEPSAPRSLIDRMLRHLPEGRNLPPLPQPGALPAHLEPVLRPYQRMGAGWLLQHAEARGFALLADDMGLGKTLQTLAVIRGRTLVILPLSLLGNWKQESARFRPDLRCSVYHGSGRRLDPEAKIILTTYSVLQLDAEILCAEEWDLVVLDEAHQIRNPETRAAIAASRLSARFRVALTGTPIQNSKRDLLSLFQFLAPGLFREEEELEPRALSPYVLRRTKEQVLTELPPKTRVDHLIPLSDEEQALVHALLSAAKRHLSERLDEERALEPLGIFEVLLRVRQACCHPGLLDPSQAEESSSKLDALLGLVDEIISEGHSVLVYSQWTSFLDLIELRLQGRSPLFRLDGKSRNRSEKVDAFQGSDRPSVFLLSLHAGGVGLNLTRANHVIFCDPWWNPAVEVQAEDRAYRMGQEKPVTIHRLIAENTLESAIRTLQAAKRELGSQTLGESSVSTRELLELL
jgi:superfamily II DNA or RNA helicase